MIGDTAPKQWRIAVDALAVLTAVALLLSGWALFSRFEETNARRADNARVWHAVICQIEQAAQKRKDQSPAKKIADLKFYDRLLTEDVGTVGCGYVQHLVQGGH